MPDRLALVVLPRRPPEEPQFMVAVMSLLPSGDIDWENGRHFVLTRKDTEVEANAYATGLAQILDLDVLAIVKA
jgi:hypothetical protein